ncbi:MAG: RecX family transcriptional regulator [Rhodospirillales bacterium]
MAKTTGKRRGPRGNAGPPSRAYSAEAAASVAKAGSPLRRAKQGGRPPEHKKSGARKRAPRKATAKHLENAALYYLQRFATSAENLKRVLNRKVDRSARFHGTDADEGRAVVEDLITRFRRSGLLDDETYARARAETLHRRGAGRRAIRAKLRQKGVADEAIEAALAALGEAGEAELAAAVNFARRRRLGPFGQEARRAKGPTGTKESKGSGEGREKALAALARAGFSFDVARRVVDAEDADALGDALGNALGDALKAGTEG